MLGSMIDCGPHDVGGAYLIYQLKTIGRGPIGGKNMSQPGNVDDGMDIPGGDSYLCRVQNIGLIVFNIGVRKSFSTSCGAHRNIAVMQLANKFSAKKATRSSYQYFVTAHIDVNRHRDGLNEPGQGKPS